MRLVRSAAFGVRKMKSLRKEKADIEKKKKKKRALRIRILVEMLFLDDQLFELPDPELMFSAEELLGQNVGAEEEIDNGDGSLNFESLNFTFTRISQF
ncbi:hypothetical protein RchiOBHm_Chr7g0237301 [Rosa chinensis]|uniref:Uncharacterized protein n=1 Tax=Rosa chinensis TaxID=74649 RepID=A0A2P6PH77_ROSCH|nr:hypothetical protein RchiOBHm_Chr7g0237301 [Rosa chinensis]